MKAADIVTILLHALSEGVAAGIAAGRAKRAQLVGEAPPLGWRERQAAADAAVKR